MTPLYQAYLALAGAISLEIVGTTFLQKSEQFTKLAPSLTTAICYAGAFYLLSQTLKVIPIGLAYAIWSGLGIVAISAIGWVFFRQSLDIPAMLGIALIVAGVLVINLFSNSLSH